MSVCENHPFAGQSIDRRREDFAALGIERLDVSVTEVVAEDEDDVRFLCLICKCCRNREDPKYRGKNLYSAVHRKFHGYSVTVS